MKLVQYGYSNFSSIYGKVENVDHVVVIYILLINTMCLLNSQFVCAVIRTGLQIRKSILTLFLVVFYIDNNKKIDR